jgi:hypothetical protein
MNTIILFGYGTSDEEEGTETEEREEFADANNSASRQKRRRWERNLPVMLPGIQVTPSVRGCGECEHINFVLLGQVSGPCILFRRCQ